MTHPTGEPAPTPRERSAGSPSGGGDDIRRVLRVDGSLAAEPGVTGDEALALYRAMVRARRVDELAGELFARGEIGFHVSSRGQEAAIVGAAFVMQDRDWFFPAFRELGAALVRGMPLRRYFDNLYGNADDVSKGRQLPSHWGYKDARIASASAFSGTQIAAAVGCAWAAKMRGDRARVLVMFSSEATHSGDFHNGMNFAGVFAVPLVLLCRAGEEVAMKGEAYGVPAKRCDGSDALAVAATVREALQVDGPTLVEAVIDAGPQPAGDPLDPLRKYLERNVGWNDERDAELCGALDEDIASEARVAASVGAPAKATLFEDVFAEMPWHLKEQMRELED